MNHALVQTVDADFLGSLFALQRAGKMNFEVMLYPQSRHGIRDAGLRNHSRMLEWETMKEHLLEAGS